MNVLGSDGFAVRPAIRNGRRRVLLPCVLGAWMATTAVAFGVMADGASRAGALARAPETWPDTSRLPRDRARATLVMVAHAKCPCTRASLRELERIMADARGSLDTFVVFVAPHEGGSAHDLLDTRDAARAIPDVRVIEDESEAHVFGAATSGQVLLYDEAGKLVFRGGITPARGHEGDSAGGEVVRRFLSARSGRRAAERSVSPHASDVFGCALFDRRTP